MKLFLIINIVVLLPSLWGTPASALKKSYVVYMGKYSDDFQITKDLLHSRLDSQIEFLASFLGCKEKAKEAIFYSYRRHINGFAAEMDEDELAAIEKDPKVISVFPDEGIELQTSHSWDFLSLERNGIIPSDSLWRKARFGEDVIIGNIDTGVWPESHSFSDDHGGYGPIPSKWKGRCEDDNGSPFPCNRKLIGAKSFYQGFVRRMGLINFTHHSPRDYDGHGTHTLSTAGGNFVSGASVLGEYNGTAKGGSPKARVAAYKACWTLAKGATQCFLADIIKAFDHAIDDGVDVISCSLGGSGVDYFKSPVAIGALHAVERGITVVASAGNSGPEYGTIANVAPWVITVAASTTDRDIVAYVQLQNGVRLQGVSISKPLPRQGWYSIVSGANAKAANASTSNATQCAEGALDPEKVMGNIVVCIAGDIPEVLMGKHATENGAAGMILCHESHYDPEPHFLPTTLLLNTDCLSLLSYINNTVSPMGFMTSPKDEFGKKHAPVMASFSSRGPNILTPEILKPDVTAPGVSIMAAFSEAAPPTEVASDKRITKYRFMSGTSMSCPHVAGIAGLLKGLHPDWSPAAIRSALMTTATTIDNTNQPILDKFSGQASPLHYGAGHIRPSLAADPGLVYDLSMKDYHNFLSAIGYNRSEFMQFPNKFNLLDFNYPSITIPKLSNTSVTVRRDLKNMGYPGTYVARIREPLGVSISVRPEVLRFRKLGSSRRFRLTITKNSTSLAKNQYVYGELIWSDGKHNVRSPIVIGSE